ncbi:MAG TPA: DUF1996 domain-containing protein [Sphingomicrobium sp.]|nr:DUF1996 domain-containing protein [Sphingomicrobium sp.]
MRAIVLASTAIILASTALASTDPVVDTRQIMAGTVTTPKIKNEYLSGARDGTAPFQGALKAYKAVRAAEAPPPPPPPPPPANPLLGEAPIASNFDVNSELVASWGSGAIPPSASPDVVGAFRFLCNAGQLLYDDPIVFPGQPGKSHLHQFYGNTGANANSTYASLRGGGSSTCMSPLNRSGYWMPAMLDGKGNVIRPDAVWIYYKRRPMSDPVVSDPTNPKYEGQAVDLPNGLKFIFGFDMLTGKAPTGSLYFNCDGNGSVQGHYPTIEAAVASGNCKSGTNPDPTKSTDRARIGAVVNAPSCWNGKDLDSPNHREHVTYASYGSWGYAKCPSTHPYVIPDFTLQAWFYVAPGDDLSQWRLSSDEMRPELPHGSTFHADFFMAWDPTVKKMWHDNCLNKKLNCSGGDLGNGRQLRMFTGFSVVANPRLVPIPPNPAGAMAGMEH